MESTQIIQSPWVIGLRSLRLNSRIGENRLLALYTIQLCVLHMKDRMVGVIGKAGKYPKSKKFDSILHPYFTGLDGKCLAKHHLKF